MAALLAVLNALLRSGGRSLNGVGAITGNNIIAVIGLLGANEPLDRPSSTAVFYLFIGLLYTVPLSLELDRRIPRERMELWPLSWQHRLLLTGANLLLNPLLLLAMLFAGLSRHPAVGAALMAAGLVAPPLVLISRAVGPRLFPQAGGRLPRLPMLPGRHGGLVLNHLREMLQSLDVYLAGALATGGVAYRVYDPSPDPAATDVIGGLVVMLLSTLAQPSHGFDPEALSARMQLFPVSAVDRLLVRDLAWLLIATFLLSTYPPIPWLSAALAALAVGHSTASERPLEQKRGHFATGRLGPTGLFQLGAIALSAAMAVNFGWPVLALTFGVFAGSTWWSSRSLGTAG